MHQILAYPGNHAVALQAINRVDSGSIVAIQQPTLDKHGWFDRCPMRDVTPGQLHYFSAFERSYEVEVMLLAGSINNGEINALGHGRRGMRSRNDDVHLLKLKQRNI